MIPIIAVNSISHKYGKYNISSKNDIDKISIKKTDAIPELQKAATDFKRSNQLDLAVACLKKANDISDHCEYPVSKETYMRLITYLELAGYVELARQEEQKIHMHHPEFFDYRISNKIRIQEVLLKQHEYNNDCVLVSTNSHCPICKQYNLKVYSISGKTKKYPKLPAEISQDGGFCPDCHISLYSYFDGISTPPNNSN